MAAPSMTLALGAIRLSKPVDIEALKAATPAPAERAVGYGWVGSSLIADITQLEAETPASPGAGTCGPGTANVVVYPVTEHADYLGTLPPDGIYRTDLVAAELIERGSSPRFAAPNAGLTTWTFNQAKPRSTRTTSTVTTDARRPSPASTERWFGLLRLAATAASTSTWPGVRRRAASR